MEDKSEKKKLNKLGIFSSEQLEFNSLNFWWQKKYKEIQNNIELENPEESLIEVNNLRDELEKFDMELLKSFLKNNDKFTNKKNSSEFQKATGQFYDEEVKEEELKKSKHQKKTTLAEINDNLKFRTESKYEENICRPKKNILLIEDDRDMRNLMARYLENYGYDVQKAEDGIKGQALAIKYRPDLIILDLMLPSVDGLSLCQRLRRDERTSNIPILMITALGGLKDKVTGFNSGADDYIVKPFDLEELYVRIKVLLRKFYKEKWNSSNQQEILNYGPLTLVPERFEAIWFESPIRLTHLEFELLHCLLQRHGQTVSPALILKEVWGYEPDDDIETIRIHIRHLRTKLEPDPRKPIYIKTVYGAGYSLIIPS